jgi:hypothetical protein
MVMAFVGWGANPNTEDIDAWRCWGLHPETSPRFSADTLSEISKVAILVRNRPYRLTVIPAKAGIHA